MLQRWRAVDNTVSDLTGPRFEPQTSRSRDERVTKIQQLDALQASKEVTIIFLLFHDHKTFRHTQ